MACRCSGRSVTTDSPLESCCIGHDFAAMAATLMFGVETCTERDSFTRWALTRYYSSIISLALGLGGGGDEGVDLGHLQVLRALETIPPG